MASMGKLLLGESGVLNSSSTHWGAKINKALQQRLEGVRKELDLGSESRGEEVGEEDADGENDETSLPYKQLNVRQEQNTQHSVSRGVAAEWGTALIGDDTAGKTDCCNGFAIR